MSSTATTIVYINVTTLIHANEAETSVKAHKPSLNVRSHTLTQGNIRKTNTTIALVDKLASSSVNLSDFFPRCNGNGNSEHERERKRERENEKNEKFVE